MTRAFSPRSPCAPSCRTGRTGSGAPTGQLRLLVRLLLPALQYRLELLARLRPAVGGRGHVDRVLRAAPREVRLLYGVARPGDIGRVLGQRGPGVLPDGPVDVAVRVLLEPDSPVVDQALLELLGQVELVRVGVLEVRRGVDGDADEVLAVVGRVVDLAEVAVDADGLPLPALGQVEGETPGVVVALPRGGDTPAWVLVGLLDWGELSDTEGAPPPFGCPRPISATRPPRRRR